MGAFRKSSGIEDACKTLDAAEAAGDFKKMSAAEIAFSKALGIYQGTLQKALAGEETATYKAEVKKLQDSLEGFLQTYKIKSIKSKQSIYDQQTKRSIELVQESAKRYGDFRQLIGEIEKIESLSDAAMARIVEALDKNAAEKVRVEINNIDEYAKNVRDKKAALKKLVDVAASSFIRDSKSFDISAFEKGVNPITTNIERGKKIVDDMRELSKKADESIFQIDDDLKRAKAALKGKVDSNAIYIDEINKLSKRGIELNQKLEADLRYVTHMIDHAELESIKSVAEKDPVLKSKILEKALEEVAMQRARIKIIAELIEKGKRDMTNELSGFPKTLDSIEAFADPKKDVLEVVNHFDELKSELKSSIQKGIAIEKKRSKR